jgi:hypothetical protein
VHFFIPEHISLITETFYIPIARFKTFTQNNDVLLRRLLIFTPGCGLVQRPKAVPEIQNTHNKHRCD